MESKKNTLRRFHPALPKTGEKTVTAKIILFCFVYTPFGFLFCVVKSKKFHSESSLFLFSFLLVEFIILVVFFSISCLC